jgi:broad specificity phosphatase PhoE
MDLLLLRHGQTEWSMSGRHTGNTDLSLTSIGEKEALAAGSLVRRLLGDEPIAVLFVSPRLRARRTAELVLPDLAAEVEPLLAEFDYGDDEGLTRFEIQAKRPGWSVWTDGCPGGETPAQAVARAQRFIDTRLPGPGLAVVVSHGHFSRFLAMTMVGLPISQGDSLAMSTSSVSIIRHRHGKPSIDLWNATA